MIHRGARADALDWAGLFPRTECPPSLGPVVHIGWITSIHLLRLDFCCSVAQSCPAFAASQTAACQASLSFTSSQKLLKFMSIALVMPSTHFICCHPLSSCLQSFPHQGLFQWVSSSHQVAKVLEFQLQHQSFQWICRTDFLWDWLVRSPWSPRDSQELIDFTFCFKSWSV